MKRPSGFTLVELLVVVVVIGILASISVIAFSGIQDKAKHARFLASLDGYQKALQLYNIYHNEYPRTVDQSGVPLIKGDATFACLGSEESYPATSLFEAGACQAASGYVHVVARADDAFNEKIRSITPGLNLVVENTVTISSFNYRGIQYYSNGTTTNIMYYLSGDKPCERGTKLQYPPGPWIPNIPDGVTFCNIQL